MLGALAFVTMRQQHDETVGAQPFGLSRSNELVDHDLRAVGKIAELRFPHDECLGVGHRIAIFETQYAVFG